MALTRLPQSDAPFRWAPLYWLALGTFAVGTEGFMIAAILPGIASDLSVSVQAAGQLVAVFALTYAVSSPVLTALTGHSTGAGSSSSRWRRSPLRNSSPRVAPGYWALVAARVLLALSAGLYVPSANALPAGTRAAGTARAGAGHRHRWDQPGRGLGVPTGLVGAQFGWRMTFLGVAGLASLACAGCSSGCRAASAPASRAASLGERLAVVRRPGALRPFGHHWSGP